MTHPVGRPEHPGVEPLAALVLDALNGLHAQPVNQLHPVICQSNLSKNKYLENYYIFVTLCH
jgi:hypothetical protein